jgi:hypothetical protein
VHCTFLCFDKILVKEDNLLESTVVQRKSFGHEFADTNVRGGVMIKARVLYLIGQSLQLRRRGCFFLIHVFRRGCALLANPCRNYNAEILGFSLILHQKQIASTAAIRPVFSWKKIDQYLLQIQASTGMNVFLFTIFMHIRRAHLGTSSNHILSALFLLPKSIRTQSHRHGAASLCMYVFSSLIICSACFLGKSVATQPPNVGE